MDTNDLTLLGLFAAVLKDDEHQDRLKQLTSILQDTKRAEEAAAKLRTAAEADAEAAAEAHSRAEEALAAVARRTAELNDFERRLNEVSSALAADKAAFTKRVKQQQVEAAAWDAEAQEERNRLATQRASLAERETTLTARERAVAARVDDLEKKYAALHAVIGERAA